MPERSLLPPSHHGISGDDDGFGDGNDPRARATAARPLLVPCARPRRAPCAWRFTMAMCSPRCAVVYRRVPVLDRVWLKVLAEVGNLEAVSDVQLAMASGETKLPPTTTGRVE